MAADNEHNHQDKSHRTDKVRSRAKRQREHSNRRIKIDSARGDNSVSDPHSGRTRLSEFLEENRGALFRFCRGILRDHAAAEDAVQDVCTLAIQSIDSGKIIDELGFRYWLYRISRNHCLDLVRRAKVEREYFRTLGGELKRETRHSLHLGKESFEEEVRPALQKLSKSDQEIIRLRFCEKLAFEEIGEILGISRNTAIVRLHRATHRAKDALDGTSNRYNIRGNAPQKPCSGDQPPPP